MAVLHFFSSKFHSNIFYSLYVLSSKQQFINVKLPTEKDFTCLIQDYVIAYTLKFLF